MLKIHPRIESSKSMAWFSPMIAIVLTLCVSGLILLWLNVSPMKAFHVFLIEPFSNTYNLGELMVKATPLMLCAIGLAICYRANIWNIGAEGQLLIGAVASSAIAVHASENAGAGMLVITLLTGAFAGMMWAAIPTFLNRYFHTSILF
ncbi:hypothetical protein P4S72_01130 [Vibrio sp. PP-XX7]